MLRQSHQIRRFTAQLGHDNLLDQTSRIAIADDRLAFGGNSDFDTFAFTDLHPRHPDGAWTARLCGPNRQRERLGSRVGGPDTYRMNFDVGRGQSEGRRFARHSLYQPAFRQQPGSPGIETVRRSLQGFDNPRPQTKRLTVDHHHDVAGGFDDFQSLIA